jgi:hypothetical protein
MTLGERKQQRQGEEKTKKEELQKTISSIKKTWGDYRRRALEFINKHASYEDKAQMISDPHFREGMIQTTAENMAIQDLEIPPGWSGMYDCEHCGVMPAPSGVELKVVGCPWCHVIKVGKLERSLLIDNTPTPTYDKSMAQPEPEIQLDEIVDLTSED